MVRENIHRIVGGYLDAKIEDGFVAGSIIDILGKLHFHGLVGSDDKGHRESGEGNRHGALRVHRAADDHRKIRHAIEQEIQVFAECEPQFRSPGGLSTGRIGKQAEAE